MQKIEHLKKHDTFNLHRRIKEQYENLNFYLMEDEY